MQQTWRERDIPSADFGNNNNNNNNNSSSNSTVGLARSGASISSVASPGNKISSPIGTPTRKRFSTPPAHNNSNNIVFGSPFNNNNTILVTNPEEAVVANVDEALGAWTSLYKFEDHFPSDTEAKTENDINGYLMLTACLMCLFFV